MRIFYLAPPYLCLFYHNLCAQKYECPTDMSGAEETQNRSVSAFSDYGRESAENHSGVRSMAGQVIRFREF